MKIVKTNQQTNVTATTSNGDMNYQLNYGVQDGKVINLNGTIAKKEVNLGSFGMYTQGENPNMNLNLNDNSPIADKQAILGDVYTIYDQLVTELNA